MLSHLAFLAIGLGILVKGAAILVEHAARLARRFQVSELVVGLVLTSVGTSLPELTFAIAASLEGSSGLVVGNVVGSNIANIGLVLGVAAMVRPFATAPKMYERDGFILVGSSVVLFVLVLDNGLGALEGLFFLVVYVAYVAFAARSDREGVEARFKDFLAFFFDLEYAAPARRIAARRSDARARSANSTVEERGGDRHDRGQIAREAVLVALSLAAIVVSSGWVVDESVEVARILGVPENLVGLSLLALGTSLPELMVAITAARQGNAEMVVGNVMGSNVANTLLILGLSAIVRPLAVPELSVVYTIPIMLFFSLALLHFIRSDWRMSRAQGVMAVTAYLAFLTAAFVQGWG